jgi:hypothetical protein
MTTLTGNPSLDLTLGRPAVTVAPYRRTHVPVAWLTAVLPFIALVIWFAKDGPLHGGSDDYAQYLMHAQALAEGRAYTDIGYIYTPLNHWLGPATAPPGLPLLLAPFIALFGPNMIVLGSVMLLFGITFLLLSGSYFARHEDRLLGLGVVLLSGLSAMMLQQASWVLTDLPFAALIWLVISLADRTSEWTWRRTLLITFLGGFAILVRPMGIALIPALLLLTAVKYRTHGLKPAGPLMIWFGSLVLVALFVNLQQVSVLALNPGRVLRWLQETQWGLEHVTFYRLTIFHSHLYPLPADPLNDAFHFVSVVLMGIGLVAWVRRSWRSMLFTFAVVYLAMLMIIPAHQHRYAWPLFPLLVYGLLEGIRIVVTKLRPSLMHTRFTPAHFALASAGLIAAGQSLRVPGTGEHRSATEPASVRRVYAKLREMKQHESLRVTFVKPRSLAWETGVPAMGPFTAPVDRSIKELQRKGITHIIVVSKVKEGLAGLPAARPDLFRLEYRGNQYSIYRFLQACRCDLPLNSGKSCCPLLTKEGQP